MSLVEALPCIFESIVLQNTLEGSISVSSAVEHPQNSIITAMNGQQLAIANKVELRVEDITRADCNLCNPLLTQSAH